MASRPSSTSSRSSYAEADELPEEVDQRLGEIETALAAFEERPLIYDGADVARAGTFVSIDTAGCLRVERGYVRPEDEAPVASPDDEDAGHDTGDGRAATGSALMRYFLIHRRAKTHRNRPMLIGLPLKRRAADNRLAPPPSPQVLACTVAEEARQER